MAYPESTVTFWLRQAANKFAIEHPQKDTPAVFSTDSTVHYSIELTINRTDKLL